MLDHDHMKMNLWACAGIGACVGGFVTHAIPYLQFTALCISIFAGIRTLILSRKVKKPAAEET